jgi:hypothetical protein
VAGNGLEPRRSVVSKVVAIVRSFGSGGSLTVTEISQAANLPLSTTHRLVHELAAWGVLHRGAHARFEIVQRPLPGCGDCGPDLRALAAPTVEDLSAATRSDIRLGRLCGFRVLCGEDRREPAALGVLGRRNAPGARHGARQGVARFLTRGNRRPCGPTRTPQLHIVHRHHRRAAAPIAQRDEAAGGWRS